MRAAAKLRPVILAVDDDPDVLAIVRLILDEHYEILTAPDGLAALAAVASRDVDLVLLDVVMPGIDGITVLELLQSRPRRVPVVVVSGVHAAAVAATAMRLGAVDYLTKPFEEEELRSIVDSILQPSPESRPLGPAVPRPLPRILFAGCESSVVACVAVAISSVAHVDCVGRTEDLARYLEHERPHLVVVDASGDSSGADRLALVDMACWHRPVLVIGAVPVAPAPAGRSRRSTLLRWPLRPCDLFQEIAANLPADLHHLPAFSDRTLDLMEAVSANVAAIGVRELGRTMGRSPYNLSRLFRSETGMGLKAFVNRVRVEVARQLLASTNEKIETVATRIGFHDASHLSRMFHTYTGLRPGDVRRPAEKVAGA